MNDVRAMKRRATGLLVLAVVVYVIARTLEAEGGAWGYVRAAAEAAMVGGLADWFAVTALFRHPLRIPIPHTAIIPKRKDAIGDSLGDFVQTNFLSAEVVAPRVEAAAPAERLGSWLANPDSARSVAGQIGTSLSGVAEVLDDRQVQAAIDEVVVDRLSRLDAANGIATAIEAVTNGRHHEVLVDALSRVTIEYLIHNQATLRLMLGDESPWWVPGAVDDAVFRRLHEAAYNVVSAIRYDQGHPARDALDRQLASLVERLRTDEVMRRKVATAVANILDHPDVRQVSATIGQELKQFIVTEMNDPNSAARVRVEQAIVEFGGRIRSDENLRKSVDDWLVRAAVHVSDQLRPEVAGLISSTVERWDGEETSDRIEQQIGRDLQFIRINGTLVGGLAGLAIHAIGTNLL
ncbi:MAG: DUF445 domain-containing protein [Actinomycetia bacterium]|nr:DUF445 domain-containing protein [Actinomycetes bacterium]MCP4959340.1 DUF445 domain-containing protein [Actinomycetes bacterium]